MVLVVQEKNKKGKNMNDANKLTIYTSNNCPKCKQLKQLLENKKIIYTECNIDENFKYKALLLSKNFMGVPVVYINENYYTNSDMLQLFQIISK